jgi:hypothetical protein
MGLSPIMWSLSHVYCHGLVWGVWGGWFAETLVHRYELRVHMELLITTKHLSEPLNLPLFWLCILKDLLRLQQIHPGTQSPRNPVSRAVQLLVLFDTVLICILQSSLFSFLFFPSFFFRSLTRLSLSVTTCVPVLWFLLFLLPAFCQV